MRSSLDRMSITTTLLLLVGCAFLVGCFAAPVKTPLSSSFEQKRIRSNERVIRVDKIAHKMLGGPAPTADQGAVAQTPRARLLWKKRWAWDNDESVFNRELHHGLSGGPTVSLEAPIVPGISLESRVSSFRYALPEQRTRPATPDALMRQRDNEQSIEAGVYLNFSFGD